MRNTITYVNLRAEMARRGMTISDVAAHLGKDRMTVSRKLSGKDGLYTISLPEALQLSRLFAKPIEYLFAELFETE